MPADSATSTNHELGAGGGQAAGAARCRRRTRQQARGREDRPRSPSSALRPPGAAARADASRRLRVRRTTGSIRSAASNALDGLAVRGRARAARRPRTTCASRSSGCAATTGATSASAPAGVSLLELHAGASTTRADRAPESAAIASDAWRAASSSSPRSRSTGASSARVRASRGVGFERPQVGVLRARELSAERDARGRARRWHVGAPRLRSRRRGSRTLTACSALPGLDEELRASRARPATVAPSVCTSRNHGSRTTPGAVECAPFARCGGGLVGRPSSFRISAATWFAAGSSGAIASAACDGRERLGRASPRCVSARASPTPERRLPRRRGVTASRNSATASRRAAGVEEHVAEVVADRRRTRLELAGAHEQRERGLRLAHLLADQSEEVERLRVAPRRARAPARTRPPRAMGAPLPW